MDNLSNFFKSKHSNNCKSGFSIIEVLLVLAIFSIIVFLSLPLVSGAFVQNDSEDASLLTVSTIRQAQNNARNGLQDSVWGVRINFPTLILFRGATYASRDPTYDSELTLSSHLTISGLSEITFSKLDGLPSTTGNIVITNLNNKTVTIYINEKGTIFY